VPENNAVARFLPRAAEENVTAEENQA
jgi:hypothetical protein